MVKKIAINIDMKPVKTSINGCSIEKVINLSGSDSLISYSLLFVWSSSIFSSEESDSILFKSVGFDSSVYYISFLFSSSDSVSL